MEKRGLVLLKGSPNQQGRVKLHHHLQPFLLPLMRFSAPGPDPSSTQLWELPLVPGLPRGWEGVAKPPKWGFWSWHPSLQAATRHVWFAGSVP